MLHHDDVTCPCAGNPPVPGEFPAQRPVTRSFEVFFDLHPNKQLSKQWWGWWFETPSCPLWRHRKDISCQWCISQKFHRWIHPVSRSKLLILFVLKWKQGTNWVAQVNPAIMLVMLSNVVQYESIWKVFFHENDFELSIPMKGYPFSLPNALSKLLVRCE